MNFALIQPDEGWQRILDDPEMVKGFHTEVSSPLKVYVVWKSELGHPKEHKLGCICGSIQFYQLSRDLYQCCDCKVCHPVIGKNWYPVEVYPKGQ